MKRYRDYKIELPDYETAMELLSCVESKATSIGMQVFDQGKGKGTFGNYIAFLINTVLNEMTFMDYYFYDSMWFKELPYFCD